MILANVNLVTELVGICQHARACRESRTLTPLVPAPSHGTKADSQRMPSTFCTEFARQNGLHPDGLSVLNIVLCCVNGFFSAVAIVSNSLVIFAIWKTDTLHSPSFVLLCSLAISDLSVGLISQPLYIAYQLTATSRYHDASCVIGTAYFSLGIGLAAFSFFLITQISVDRFLAVHLLVKYRHTVTVPRMIITLILLAVTSGLAGSSYIIKQYIWYTFVAPILMIICFLISTFAYAKSLWILRHRQAQMNECLGGQPRIGFARYQKTTNSMLMLYCAFMLCYLPYGCYVVVVKISGPNIIAHDITSTLIYLNSSLNPALYFWRIREIRQGVKQICKPCRTNQNNQAELNGVAADRHQTLPTRI